MGRPKRWFSIQYRDFFFRRGQQCRILLTVAVVAIVPWNAVQTISHPLFPEDAPTHTRASQVFAVAQAIRAVQPNLSLSLSVIYADQIFRAALAFHVSPYLLVAITQRESSFRNYLPEGPAGEIGLCQIRKIWLEDPRFLKAFGKVSVRELSLPSRHFYFAGWILSQKKKRNRHPSLPYWTMYNSAHPKARQRYFKQVDALLNLIFQVYAQDPLNPRRVEKSSFAA